MIILFIITFLFGLAAGSFLNCLIYRLAHKKTLFGRSFCPRCQHQIAWYDNIPILSFIILGGRCRHCHQKISWQYPLVELITGFFLVINFFIRLNQFPISDFRLPIILIRDWLMIFVSFFIFIYDLKYYLIEDIVILPITGLIFIANLILKISLLNLLLAGILAVCFFVFQYLITRGCGIGLGDFRIGLLMGVYFGWPKIVLAIILSYLIGAIIAIFLVILKKKKFTSRVPLGPFLVIGSLITLFYGQEILNWYLSKF
ncbi:MAG: prepilin peptidase [Minisyncoccia bacterium]